MNTQLRKAALPSSVPVTRERAVSPLPDRWHCIALAAYFKAEARGFYPGHELDDWLEAERELGRAAIGEELAA
jgi:Protein of unknown function (DUF2934)